MFFWCYISCVVMGFWRGFGFVVKGFLIGCFILIFGSGIVF